jgi:hypothetical protein
MITVSSETNLTPFDAWSVYTAMTLHFRKDSSYDAFRFNFKGPRCKRETFMAHRQRYTFEKIARAYTSKNATIEYFLANLLEGNTWIGSMNDDAYVQWQGRVQRMDYDFRSALSDLSNTASSFDSIIKPQTREDLPPIYLAYTRGKLSIETLVILDHLVNYTSSINKFVSDPLEIVSDITYRVSSYKPFIKSKIDTMKAKQNVLNLFTSVSN